jgi:hypothetical protein
VPVLGRGREHLAAELAIARVRPDLQGSLRRAAGHEPSLRLGAAVDLCQQRRLAHPGRPRDHDDRRPAVEQDPHDLLELSRSQDHMGLGHRRAHRVSRSGRRGLVSARLATRRPAGVDPA